MKKTLGRIGILMLIASSLSFAEGKDITVAVNANFISLDPHNLSDTLSGTAVSTMYEGLFTYNDDMTLRQIGRASCRERVLRLV